MGRFKPGNTLALVHGARSERTVNKVATTQKRRLLRQVGLRAGDLDGIALGYLDSWARAQAKVELLDQYADRVGWLNEDGEPMPGAKHYFTALNSARLSLARLEGHLKERPVRSPLDDYLAEAQADGA